ncbi:MAG: c-type cytochrome [Anaeromyxobacteraceae bacterium]|nr:c-type cytochrome [Anaeromyxobacteraceae bacterium]
MSKLNAGWRGWLAVAAVAALLAACGTSSRPAVTGVAQVGGPVVGEVTVIDSAAVPVRRTAGTGADGAFAVDATGLTPPFMIRVEGTGPSGPARLFSATEDGRRGDVNPITSAAFAGASGGSDDDAFEGRRGDRRETARGVVRLLQQLEVVLAPLLERYGISDPSADRAAVRQLLEDVRFEVRRGVLTVTNRATGAAIFTGPLDDLASGTFDPGAMPPGPGTTPGTGEGALLYDVSCSSCHGPLATSDVRGESAGDIQEAIEEDEGGMGALSGLTLTQLQAIAAALSGSGGGGGTPGACTYTYGAWSACVNGSQTRTVISAAPTGCTGTPVLTQSCTVTPPPIDGAALYGTYCAGCHGNSKKGSSAAAIQAAIDGNVGGMGSAALRALTPEQVAAIAAAP